ncbi:SUMF1/EgtB/PvdO family nonheme iron enzyme [Luteolibacter algae]|uniref:SUMF1/EgtB/PvdO family nonheme iron enzyme n=1 Tax=Luteolibacter algae TaxID=454151 RepID=A0ABW5D4M1_9BACT
MPSPKRTHPNIPDHDVLRKIGGGAYGEVWMARGVTGAMRAVKVVWREDFDDERTFEREFEGILKFEPISRDHPGLVNILHVGRSPDGVSFYYYVMELGDDVETGQDINPVEYEAKTLRADGKAGVRLDTNLCIDVGLRLAEALEHLHERNLAHRDVKPSNVIFVNGKAKLADIGLVAARGQRTFVGTEGFVPPEGPGSAQADVYSLGKVLYEIATGKDRLDFPELPDEIPTGLERKRWLELNKIICDICEPRISKRKISTARDLASALHRLQRGKTRRSRNISIWATTCVLFGFASWASWQAMKDSELLPWNHVPEDAPRATIVKGLLRVVTTPEGAEVFTEDGTLIGITPTEGISAPVGSEVSYVVKKTGYRPLKISATVTKEAIEEPMIVFGTLQNFSPPKIGEKWDDHLGITYLPDGDEHVSSRYVNKKIWRDFLNSSKRSDHSVEYINISENGKPSEIVLAQWPDIIAFTDWARGGGIRNGFLTQDNEVYAKVDQSFDNAQLSKRARRENLKPFRLAVREYRYGAVQLVSEPPGAEVYVNGLAVGSTKYDGSTLLIPKVKPGPVELVIVLEGFKPLTINAKIKPGENLPIEAALVKNEGVVFGQPWKNGMEMKFEPIGSDLMASVFETRVKDYETFIRDAKYQWPRRPDFQQGPNHPIIYVSREDAQAFCDWLTEREREEERIALSHRYRLPTDVEWSRMAGLEFEVGDGPGQRDANKPGIYPWGSGWPPPETFANYADTSAAEFPGTTSDRIISGYTDGFPRTAPVGSFPANGQGLYDLSGNVQEWVSDDISATTTGSLGVVRGAGWNTYLRENLLVGWRNPVPSAFHGSYYGFRVVLSKTEAHDEAKTDN